MRIELDSKALLTAVLTSTKTSFAIHFDLGRNGTAQYDVEIKGAEDGPALITTEECSVDLEGGRQWFRVDRGHATSNQGGVPVASDDKLYLVNASGLPPFEPVY